MHWLIPLCLFFTPFALVSCDGDQVKLSKTDMKMIDTLFEHEDSILNLQADIRCDSLREAVYTDLVDSFYDVQLADIRQYYDLQKKSN